MTKTVILGLLLAIYSVLADASTASQCMPAPSKKCFTVITEQKLNWNDAENYCERNVSNGGRLASIHNAFEEAIISAWLPFLTSDPWIGAIRLGSLPYQWVDNTPLDYLNWIPGQPTAGNDCALMCQLTAMSGSVHCQQGKWTTADCVKNRSQFICENGTTNPPVTTPSSPTVVEHACNSNNDKCFGLVIGSLPWTEADQFCRNHSPNSSVTTLASINNKGDVDTIATLLQYPTLNSSLWIGAFTFGDLKYQWSDKSPFSYTNWAPGQPQANAEGCVQVCLKNDITCVQGQWIVAPCKTAQAFICENIEYQGADCLDLHLYYPTLESGFYALTPPGTDYFYAYCEMETDGGGWTVFQRRMDGTLSFYDKTWNDYKYGFNDESHNNLWLGNDNIHILSTKDPDVELRIDIWGDRAPASLHSYGYWWQKQSSFSIDNEANYYTLNLSSVVTGNASSSRNIHNGINFNIGLKFSTIDKSSYDGCNGCCSPAQLGGWWLRECSYSSLNGKYAPSDWHSEEGFIWAISGNGINTSFVNPAQSRMMLRKKFNSVSQKLLN